MPKSNEPVDVESTAVESTAVEPATGKPVRVLVTNISQAGIGRAVDAAARATHPGHEWHGYIIAGCVPVVGPHITAHLKDTPVDDVNILIDATTLDADVTGPQLVELVTGWPNL